MIKRYLAFAILSAALLGAKTYTFTISEGAQAGKTHLMAGEYRLHLDGSNATLTDKAGHQVDTKAKVENGDRKYEQTAVATSEKAGIRQIDEIELGRTTTKVVFQ